jgi:hypothetical protein
VFGFEGSVATTHAKVKEIGYYWIVLLPSLHNAAGLRLV